MNKIKVVHVYKSFDVYNGLIEILSVLADTIDRNRFELSVIVNEYSGNEFGEKFIKKGGNIVVVKNGSEINKITRLHETLQRIKPHIVQTHVLRANLTAALIAKMAKVPIVVATEMTLKNIAPPGLRRMRDWVLQILLQNYAFKQCDQLIVTSEYLKKEWCPVWMYDKTETIYPPFSIEKYNSARQTKKITEKKELFTVGFVGRLSEEKRVEDLIKAIKIVIEKKPTIKCVIVGTGPLEEMLKKMVVNSDLTRHIYFNGYTNNSFEQLFEFDLFVLPSRTEGCPIVILEAMAAGLPVIATNVGGNSELVDENVTGILIPPNNPYILAERIIELIDNADIRQLMGQKAKNIAFSKFEPIQFTKRLEIVYDKLLKDKGIL